ncbi:MAG: cold-shock protein [Candidatus Methylomirabilia bacterium]
MVAGTVRWCNDAKGYGFIRAEGGEDVFVYYTAVDPAGSRSLNEGDRVEFELARGPRGLHASNVRRV